MVVQTGEKVCRPYPLSTFDVQLQKPLTRKSMIYNSFEYKINLSEFSKNHQTMIRNMFLIFENQQVFVEFFLGYRKEKLDFIMNYTRLGDLDAKNILLM